MKNNTERDEIINIFKKYSRLGLYRHNLNTFGVYQAIRGCSRSESEALDLAAVHETFKFLKTAGKDDALIAVKKIYFTCPARIIRKNEISMRVRKFALQNYCDERTVYRRLEYVLKIYANIREKIRNLSFDAVDI